MVRKDYKIGMIIGVVIFVIATLVISFWPNHRFDSDWAAPALTPGEAGRESSEEVILRQGRQLSGREKTQENETAPISRPATSPVPDIPKTPEPARRPDSEPSSAGQNAAQPKPEATRPQTVYHTVKAGETLSSIARQYYGKPSEWERIADANRRDIPDRQTIRPGMRLVIPPLP